MTATTVPAQETAERRDLTWYVAKLLGVVTYQTIVGYVLVMVVAFTLLGVGVAVFGTVENSVWDWGTQSPKYFNVAVGIMLTPVALTMLVAHGVTRKTFAIAGSLFLAVVALGMAVLWAAAYQVEGVVYGIAGWPHTLVNTHIFSSPDQSHLVILEYFLLVFSHQVTGWLLGTSFTRFGWLRGIAFMPVALVPAAAAELLLITQWIGALLLDAGWERPPLGIAVPATLLVTGAGLILNYLLLRPIGLKPTRG